MARVFFCSWRGVGPSGPSTARNVKRNRRQCSQTTPLCQTAPSSPSTIEPSSPPKTRFRDRFFRQLLASFYADVPILHMPGTLEGGLRPPTRQELPNVDLSEAIEAVHVTPVPRPRGNGQGWCQGQWGGSPMAVPWSVWEGLNPQNHSQCMDSASPMGRVVVFGCLGARNAPAAVDR